MSVIHLPVLAVGDHGAAGVTGGSHEAHRVPELTLPDAGSRVAPTLGHRLVDDYLESASARLRPDSTLAVVYDLKIFFSVVQVDPIEVRRRHVLEFIPVQRTGSSESTVIPIDQSKGFGVVDDPAALVDAGGVLWAPRRAR